MGKFLSCDWGTSSFRLRLVETPHLASIQEEISGEGIAQSFRLWQQRGHAQDARLSFYLQIVHNHIQEFERKLGYSLRTIPLIISGMAGSAMGMIELPYKELPFSVDGSDLIVKLIEDGNNLSDVIIIISGARTNEDVMRGEETQLVGCSGHYKRTGKNMFIFPGTHSKHIIVEGGKATIFRTYMTGEFFELLSLKSVLSVSVESGGDLTDEKNKHSFDEGIEESIKSNLLHSAFRVRANDLLNKTTKEKNYYYLSGLLIGTEVKESLRERHDKIILVTNALVGPYYERALNILQNHAVPEIIDADQALIRGQFSILKRILEK